MIREGSIVYKCQGFYQGFYILFLDREYDILYINTPDGPYGWWNGPYYKVICE